MFSRPRVIENPKKYLPLRTDILQKTVVGFPWEISFHNPKNCRSGGSFWHDKQCTYLKNLFKFFPSLTDESIFILLVFPVQSSMFSYVSKGMHLSAKSSRVVPGWANARPRAKDNFLKPHPLEWQGAQMPSSCPVGEGMGAPWIDWCFKVSVLSFAGNVG